MTQKQRFLTAMRRETPDMVPVSPLFHCRYAQEHLGRSDWKAVFECHKEIGSCHFRGPIGIGHASDPVEGYEYTSEVLVDDPPHRVEQTTLHTPFGDLTSTHDAGSIPHDPLVGKTTEYYVKEPEHWKIFIDMWEKALATARPHGSETVEEAARVMGEDGVPSVALGSASTAVASQRGMQEFMYDLYDCPDLIRRALQVACDLHALTIESFLMSAAEVGFYDICWLTGMNLGAKLLDEWLSEEIGRMCSLVRQQPGKFISFYTLGRMRDIMPILVDAGPHMIATFEPNEGDISLGEAQELYGDRIAVMGNFDCVILARGTLEEARDEAKRCLEEAMAGGGYIMGTGDEVPTDAKPENLRAMVEVVEEFGRY